MTVTSYKKTSTWRTPECSRHFLRNCRCPVYTGLAVFLFINERTVNENRFYLSGEKWEIAGLMANECTINNLLRQTDRTKSTSSGKLGQIITSLKTLTFKGRCIGEVLFLFGKFPIIEWEAIKQKYIADIPNVESFLA